ncbi:MAG: restriction endonuclease subunit S [Nanoarchaeota archaeon]|nr:restriction endonuclease subunit S [Nanoarchaeota archaeon]
MAEWKKVKLKEVLNQYRNTHWVEDKNYKQVTISQTGEVSYRGTKHGSQIGRKRQFIIDLKNHPNTLIFIRQGVFNGGIGICPKEVDGCLVTENMPMFDIVNINPEYLIYYLKSPQFKKEVDKLVPLGTAQKAIHERQLLEIEIFLPSPKEQEEIVKLLKSNSDNISELDIINNKNKNYIVKLKQQILLEAVQGKLVKQDPKDEPASELLKKIKAGKDKLVKEGKIRKEKPLKPISEDEIPYDLPKGWEWVRLGELVKVFAGNSFDSYDFNDQKGVKAIKITNVGVGEFIETEDYLPESFLKKYEDFKVNKGDIIISLTRPYISAGLKVCICPESYDLSLLNQRVASIKKTEKIDFNYLYLFLRTNYVLNKFKSRFGKAGLQPNLKMGDLIDLEFPLPSIDEQKRIVEKVDKLMGYCNELEKQVKDNQRNSEKLMVAVLKESFEK